MRKQHKQMATVDKAADFIDERELLQRLPICRRTLATWRATGKIPYVCVGGRRILYHWPTVEKAILRFQKNGDTVTTNTAG